MNLGYMRKNFILVFGILMSLTSYAQNTWSDNVAQIVYTNCSSCHNSFGIAPFDLITYADAKAQAGAISAAVQNKSMPPWIADSDYQRYAHERVLSESEITIIKDWVANGSPEGNAQNTPPPPVFTSKGFITKKPDLELRMPVYSSKATAFSDDYVCFSVPANIAANKNIKAFEVIPGNHTIVHHALVYIDETGMYGTDTSAGVCTGPTNGLIGGYVPGSPPTVFPSNGTDFNLGFKMTTGSNIVLAMHYPEGSYGNVDSTIIRFWFYDDGVNIRELQTKPFLENWDFSLPPNQVTDVQAQRNIGANDVSVLSVFPHMHLLGSEIGSHAVSQQNDTIRFAQIPHWDFEWQEFLFFNRIKKVPKYSTLYGYGKYDNTTNNSHNPSNPPVLVRPGLNTSDEMFLIYFHYMLYEPGDENRNIEQLTSLSDQNPVESMVRVYPNPTSNEVMFSFIEDVESTLSIRLYDLRGNLVSDLAIDASQSANSKQVRTKLPEHLNPGMYCYSINNNGHFYSGKIIIAQ